MNRLFDFIWDVCVEGYEWVQACALHQPGGNKTQTYLTMRPAGTYCYTAKRYRPLEDHPALFRTFSSTPCTEEGIAAFATIYGSLGINTIIGIGTRENEHTIRYSPFSGDSLADWCTEISTMRRLILLWELAQSNDSPALAKYITWGANHQGVTFHEETETTGKWEIIADTDIHPELLRRLPPGDLILPAKAYVQRVANKSMENRLSPTLVWDKEMLQLTLKILPDNLLGALWFQFSMSISEGKTFEQCRQCHGWFEVTRKPSAKLERLFCSPACRHKAYRDRRAHAVQLHEEGWELDKIATHMNADVTSVARWVSRTHQRTPP